MIFLTAADLLHVAERTLGGKIEIRDYGLIESGAARPQASAFRSDAYPTLEDKVAALLHSLARGRPLVDGNKRLSLAGAIAFLGVNGRRLTLSNDEAYDFVIAVATGELDDTGRYRSHRCPDSLRKRSSSRSRDSAVALI